MRSREARIGTQVRLLDGGRRGGRACLGMIERTYGHPDYLAMDVRFEDGDAELCWYHELAKVDGKVEALAARPRLVGRGTTDER